MASTVYLKRRKYLFPFFQDKTTIITPLIQGKETLFMPLFQENKKVTQNGETNP
jgi:hypothetical protein